MSSLKPLSPFGPDVALWLAERLTVGPATSFLLDDVVQFPSVTSRSSTVYDGGDRPVVLSSSGIVIEANLASDQESGVGGWQLRLRNNLTMRSGRISRVRSLDLRLPVDRHADLMLHRWHGSENRRDDFGPVQPVAHYAGGLEDWYAPDTGERIKPAGGQVGEIPGRDPRLEPTTAISFGPVDGRSSDGHFPVFDLDWGDEGLLVAIGWSGQWIAEVERDLDGVRISVGLEHLDCVLEPGESIPLPEVALLPWRGPRVDAYNAFRKYLRDRVLPRIDGRLPLPPVAASSFFVFDEGLSGTEDRHLELLRDYLDREIPIDTYWVDAGWFGSADSWVRHVGDWFPDPVRFPRGLRPIADAAHDAGLRFLLWFEPERVFEGTELARDHPDWLLALSGDPESLLDLGNPDARAWITDRVSSLIASEAVDIYRQDLNFAPLPYWLANDEPNRTGMREVRHVEGLYAFWDSLRARHPGLLIDNCAGGGRRIDLSTMARSVTLTRSDYLFEPVGNQGQTWGLSHLLPLWGVTMNRPDPVQFRAGLGGGLVIIGDITSTDPRLTRQLVAEYAELRTLVPEADVYPLTAYSISAADWSLVRFDRPAKRDGVILGYRRSESPFSRAEVRFGPVQTGAAYEFTDLDGQRWSVPAADLDANGLAVEIGQRNGSRVIRYRWDEAPSSSGSPTSSVT